MDGGKAGSEEAITITDPECACHFAAFSGQCRQLGPLQPLQPGNPAGRAEHTM